MKTRLEAIWRAITWDDVILLGFRKDCSEVCIVSATDKDAIDDLANRLAEWFKKQSAKNLQNR